MNKREYQEILLDFAYQADITKAALIAIKNATTEIQCERALTTARERNSEREYKLSRQSKQWDRRFVWRVDVC